MDGSGGKAGGRQGDHADGKASGRQGGEPGANADGKAGGEPGANAGGIQGGKAGVNSANKEAAALSDGAYPEYVTEGIERLRTMLDKYGSDILSRVGRSYSGEMYVLRFLALRSGEPVHPSELVGCIHTSAARVTAILGSLEKKGHVVRKSDPVDRRRVLVHLTAAGLDHVREAAAEVTRVTAIVMSRLGERDSAEFIRILDSVLSIYTEARRDS
jgi:DNA-binding MarR family transcriptional regulator